MFILLQLGMNLTICLGMIAYFAAPLSAGKYNPILDIGDVAPPWSNVPGVDGKKHSSDEVAGSITLLVFTCNSCPYAVDAEGRLIAFFERYRELNVRLVVINSNDGDTETLEAMKRRSKSKSFDFTYLRDADHVVAQAFGAKYTPECFVLDRDRRVIYMGSLDDSPDGKSVAKRYVDDAVQATMSGDSPEITETVPIGCRISIKRRRRR